MTAVIFALTEILIYVCIVYVIIRTIKKKKRDSLEYSKTRRESEFRLRQEEYAKDLDEILKDMTDQVNTKAKKTTPDIKSADITSSDMKSTDTKSVDIKTSGINTGDMKTPVSSSGAVSPTEDAADGEQKSTTDYLAEKARLDQIDHAREKREEIRRLSQKSGGLFPAERLYDGDPVPGGKHCVICGYCAAENLVPNGSTRKYSCYFCREPL